MDWDHRFSIDDYLFGKEPAKALLKLENYLVPNGETFVVADGEGRNSVYLASKGYKVTASDSSKVANEKAQELALSRSVKVNYRVEDFFDIDWSEKQYDNVVGICFQFVPPQKINEALLGLRAATKKGGILLIHGYTPDQIELGTGGPKDVSLMYTRKTFTNVFKDDEIIVNEEYRANLSEGVGHNGTSAMIDFIARL
ncbi:MAG: SAM-dependent methyltransferase [Rhodobacteraceae bacterium]|nr:SAM-dependent methyltransferase [Paracoccaceae bacterium]